jgi:UPF0716 protein FxsA
VLWLVLLLVALPSLELWLLIQVGARLGVLATVVLVLGTGVAGAALARAQGVGVLRAVQADLAAGRLPAAALVDGVIILLAAVLLMTPGLLTDAIGLLGLTPSVRALARRAMWLRLERAVRDGRFVVHDMRQVYDVRDVHDVHDGAFASDEAGDVEPDDPDRSAPRRSGLARARPSDARDTR